MKLKQTNKHIHTQLFCLEFHYYIHLLTIFRKDISKSILYRKCSIYIYIYVYIYIYIYIYHHHHAEPQARISLTLSRHFSRSCIASSRSSGLHPASLQSCCMYVQAGCLAFLRPYVGVHRSTSLMSSSLLLQQFPACLVCLTWIVFVMGTRWPYSWCLVGCCRQDLFNIAHNILM